MNAAARKLRRAQLLEHLAALATWRAECTDEMFKLSLQRQELWRKRKSLDLAIEVGMLELQILAEGENGRHGR